MKMFSIQTLVAMKLNVPGVNFRIEKLARKSVVTPQKSCGQGEIGKVSVALEAEFGSLESCS